MIAMGWIFAKQLSFRNEFFSDPSKNVMKQVKITEFETSTLTR